jgi:hypothetical protein
MKYMLTICRLWAGLLCLIGVSGGTASAAAYNFATFTETGSSQPFRFINNDGGNDGVIAMIDTSSGYPPLGLPVTFNFTAGTGLSTADHDAELLIYTPAAPSTGVPASTLSNGMLDQPIDSSTLALTDSRTGKNLLSMTFISSELVGRSGSPSALVSGSEGSPAPAGTVYPQQHVLFTSDFLTFQGDNSFGLSLAAITPELSVGPGGFLNSFTADITGQFSGDAIAVPDPASLSVLGLTALTLVRRRRD